MSFPGVALTVIVMFVYIRIKNAELTCGEDMHMASTTIPKAWMKKKRQHMSGWTYQHAQVRGWWRCNAAVIRVILCVRTCSCAAISIHRKSWQISRGLSFEVRPLRVNWCRFKPLRLFVVGLLWHNLIYTIHLRVISRECRASRCLGAVVPMCDIWCVHT